MGGTARPASCTQGTSYVSDPGIIKIINSANYPEDFLKFRLYDIALTTLKIRAQCRVITVGKGTWRAPP